jgi:diguanylate cyclase (GGDEF)-like protein
MSAAPQRTGARLGALLVIAGVVLSIPVFVTTPIRPSMRFITIFMLVIRPPAALLAQKLPWERWNRRWLLVWPIWTIVGVALAGRLTFIGGAPALAGLLVTAFFFVGMTQPRGTSLALLPFAVASWISANGGWSNGLLPRLPLAVGMWMLVGETIALLHHQIGMLTDGLVHEASTDPLTGLGNRRDLGRELLALRPEDAVVLLDLDHFKLLNDRYGHSAGDKVLSDLGDTIRGVLRGEDSAFRLGGEEVLLLLPSAGAGGAREMLARLSSHWARTQPDVTFSAGVCVVGDVPASEAIAAADVALYRAKQAGRSCWRFAEPSNTEIPSFR